jgi:acyl-CoA dehydrogenase
MVAGLPHHAGNNKDGTRGTTAHNCREGSDVTEIDSIVAATAERIFADFADAQTINSRNDDRWKAPMWHALSEAGLPLSWVPEDLGGAGVSLGEGFSVVSAAGRCAIGVPLAETMLAGWLLAQANIAAPDAAMTVAPANPRDRITLANDGTISGRARGVAFASEVKFIAVLAQGDDGAHIALLDAEACRIEHGLGLGGDASDTVIFDRETPRTLAASPAGFDRDALLLMGAVMRSLQIAGALETMLEISVRYANERVAFEKKIGQFQAVQHNLAELAGEAAAALAAASSAADAIANGDSFADDGLLLEAAAAKIRCAEAAEKGAAIAHQVHGAIGFSSEHVLHRYTLRALGWRDDFGNESHWAVELGRRAAGRGADELWPLVASR